MDPGLSSMVRTLSSANSDLCGCPVSGKFSPQARKGTQQVRADILSLLYQIVTVFSLAFLGNSLPVNHLFNHWGYSGLKNPRGGTALSAIVRVGDSMPASREQGDYAEAKGKEKDEGDEAGRRGAFLLKSLCMEVQEAQRTGYRKTWSLKQPVKLGAKST